MVLGSSVYFRSGKQDLNLIPTVLGRVELVMMPSKQSSKTYAIMFINMYHMQAVGDVLTPLATRL